MAQSAGTSKVELWGIVDAAVRHTNNEGAGKDGLTRMIGGGMSQSRWGINVEEDLGGGSKALVVLENRLNADDGSVSTPFFQLSYLGLQGPYGRLTAGRQWNVLFDVVTSTYASFPYSPYMEAYKPELGMAMGARTSNMLKYTFATPDRSFVGSLQYSFDENNDTKALEAGLPASQAQVPAFVAGTLGGGAWKTVGGYLRYSASGFAVGGGYMRTTLPGGTDVDAWTLELCIVLSVNSILPVVCWAGISGATPLRSPPSRQREGGSDAMTSRKECNPHGNTSRNQPLGSRLCDLARERTGWRRRGPAHSRQ
nr:porin [Tepidimonas thermarum]